MPDRTRPIRKEICLNEQELSLIRHKMNQLGTRNFGAYARKMLINGYIIKVDYTEQKKLAAAVSRIATNINHVCHSRETNCDSGKEYRYAAHEQIKKAGMVVLPE